MGLGTDESFADAKTVLDRALESHRGLELEFDNAQRATRFRQRLYAARERDRKKSRQIYPVGDPGYDRSVWDALVIDKDGLLIRIRRAGLDENALGIKQIREI